LASIGALVFIGLIGLGVFAKNGWLPSTDPLTGRKTGWFGKELPKNAGSTWNPLAAPLPTPAGIGTDLCRVGEFHGHPCARRF
jgi:hypothetical protein